MTIKAIETRYKGYRFRSRLEARWAVFFDALGLDWEYEPEGFDLTDAYLDHLIESYESRMNSYQEEVVVYQKYDAFCDKADPSIFSEIEWEDLCDYVRFDRTPGYPFASDTGSITIHDIWQVVNRHREVGPPKEPPQPEVNESVSLWYLPDFYIRDLNQWVEIKPYQGPEPWSDDIRHDLFPYGLIVLCGVPGPVSTDQYYRNPPYAGTITNDTSYYLCECPDCGALGFQFDGRSARNNHYGGCGVPKDEDKNYNADSSRIAKASKAARSARFEHGENGAS